MTRQDLLASLSSPAAYDLAVVGGGATGLGVALDAALRGFSVALFEAHDFASGTSSRSTKLLHGGVRYLAQGNVSLVREALAERATVLRLAPHLAQPLAFVMPAYACWQVGFYGAGLALYDAMAGRAGLGRTRWLSPAQTAAALPGVRTEGLRGGIRYWDGQFDDARLALALARTAAAAGARVFNHLPVRSLHRAGRGADAGWVLQVQDGLGGQCYEVRARCVVNAAGVWVDGVRALAASKRPPSRLVSPSQGVHVVVERAFLAGDSALLVPRTRDGRVLFAVPWLGKLVLGTTDTPREDLPREPRPFAEELDFILREAGQVLARPVTPADIRSVWVGLRPLVAAGGASAPTRSLSREHTVVVDEGGLITVTGGKWTTYRAMAEDVLEHCFEAGALPRRGPAATSGHRLIGAPSPGQPVVPLHAPPGPHLYGTEAAAVDALPGAGRALGMGLTEAMVRHAARAEYACTVEDVLARRWRSLFLDARQAEEMAPVVAGILADEGLRHVELESFLALCRQYRGESGG